ncbi:hypothetical protein [Lignipirellula cremea]|uniref:Uncharacterized protein n=1 Tax=Lignipirellula cremea TaxID=2528010 RepID=A0A518DYH0_9BACT|nr:hypothetical protein [Lignipirellula cremea]QDU96889.1 hypothetical protein Pla8534_47110 [Lignipirellula cremea]
MQANFLFQLYCFLSIHTVLAACCCCGGCLDLPEPDGGFNAQTAVAPQVDIDDDAGGDPFAHPDDVPVDTTDDLPGELNPPAGTTVPPVTPGEKQDEVSGGKFNQFFPAKEPPYDLIYKQEKTGFAQANLLQQGVEVATLSISDTANEPDTAAKYLNAVETIEGHPSAAMGSQGIGVLVANRYQVSVRSLDPMFTPEDRSNWIRKFDLAGLANLK